MRQYTDAPLIIHVHGASLTGAQEVHVTFKQYDVCVDVTGDDLEILGDSDISLVLPQSKTALFHDGAPLWVQLNFIAADGMRKTSGEVQFPVGVNLLRRILHGNA